jgi:hypothetical protein
MLRSTVLTLLCLCAAAFAHSETILQTAAFTPLADWDSGAELIADNHWWGVRFELAQPVLIQEVGARLFGFGDGLPNTPEVFAAILELPNLTSLPPQGGTQPGLNPFPTDPPFPGPHHGVGEDDFLGHTTFSAQLRLDPGAYLLVFGSGLFGAEGGAAATYSDSPVEFGGDFVLAAFGEYGIPGPWTWTSAGFSPTSGPRILLNGVVVPTPSASLLATLALMSSCTFPGRR